MWSERGEQDVWCEEQLASYSLRPAEDRACLHAWPVQTGFLPSAKTEALWVQGVCGYQVGRISSVPVIGSRMGREGKKPVCGVFADTDAWFLLGYVCDSHNDVTRKPGIGDGGAGAQMDSSMCGSNAEKKWLQSSLCNCGLLCVHFKEAYADY